MMKSHACISGVEQIVLVAVSNRLDHKCNFHSGTHSILRRVNAINKVTVEQLTLTGTLRSFIAA